MSKPLDFPIVGPNTDPGSDLCTAMTLLEVVYTLAENIRDQNVSLQIVTLLCAVEDRLTPIFEFLKDLEDDQLIDAYQQARRETILKKGGAA